MANMTTGQGTTGQGVNQGVPTDETTDLIASNKVEGTAVFNRSGERLGEVYNFMVGKRSGKVAYAVMSFGTFLGIGGSYHPLPWERLTYDTGKGGYVVDVDKTQLGKAPSFRSGGDPFTKPEFGNTVREFWKAGGARH